MPDAKDELKQKLLSSEEARSNFITSFKDLLEKQGMSTDDDTMKSLGFKELDVKKGHDFAASMSTVIITLVM